VKVGWKNAVPLLLLVTNLTGCAGYYISKTSGPVEKDLSAALLRVPKGELKALADKSDEDNKARIYNDERAIFLAQKDGRKDSIGKETKKDDTALCVESIAAGVCPPPGVFVAVTTGDNTVYSCVTSGVAAAACTDPNVFDASTSECKVQITRCTGTAPGKIGVSKDTRAIYREIRVYNEESRWCGRTIWAIFPIPLWRPDCRSYTELTFENGRPISAREQFIEGSGFICGPFVPWMGITNEPLPDGFCGTIKTKIPAEPSEKTMATRREHLIPKPAPMPGR